MYIFTNIVLIVVSIGLFWLSGILCYDSEKPKNPGLYKSICLIGYFVMSIVGAFILLHPFLEMFAGVVGDKEVAALMVTIITLLVFSTGGYNNAKKR